ncbi:MAG: hypothetical protein ACYSUT_11535, partial [Planctomycetota bacterium]
EKNEDKQVVINKERIEFWIAQGAVASDTCAEMFKKYDIVCPQYEAKVLRRKRALAIARKLGKPFNKAERIAAEKAAEAAALAAEEAAKAAEEAAKAEAEAAKAAEEEAAKAAEAAEATDAENTDA